MSEIKLPDQTIQNLQTYVAAKIISRGFDHETIQERLLLLTEEVGELGVNLETEYTKKVIDERLYKRAEIDKNVPVT